MRYALAALICTAGLAAAAQTIPMPEVSLEPHDGKTHFYLGETIRLDMVFRNTTGTPMMLNTTDYGDMSDKVSITPADGWTPWRGQSGHDFASVQTLTDHPMRIPVRITDGYVIRKPGHYDIRVTEQRVSGGTMTKATRIPETLTNEVGIDVEEMPATMEAEIVHEVQNDLANAPEGRTGYRMRMAAFNRLASLQGDDALAEKLHLIVTEDEDFRAFMPLAMATTRNQQRQLDLLQAAWRNPANLPYGDVLDAMNETRRLMANLPLDGWQMVSGAPKPTAVEQQLATAQTQDMQDLLSSIPQRTGKSRTYAAFLVVATPTGLTDAQKQQAREYALEEFPHMDDTAQDMLMNNPQVRDPRMVPQVRDLLQKQPTDRTALGVALLMFPPDEQRQVVVNAICANGYPVPLDVIAAWHGDRLPEVDTCLAKRLKTPEEGNIGSRWNGNALLAARYATPAILPQIKQGWKLPSQDGAMLAVLTRMAPAEAVALLDKIAGQPNLPFYQEDTVLDSLHMPLPPEELAWLRTHLPNAPSKQKGTFAYELSRHGETSDEALLEGQLMELRKAWADRATELNNASWNTPEGETKATERNLIDSLFHATAWTLPQERKKMLTAACLTDACRQYSPKPTAQ